MATAQSALRNTASKKSAAAPTALRLRASDSGCFQLRWGLSPAQIRNTGWRGEVVAAAQTGGILQRLGRVLKEKAEADLDRVLKGTSKTREKLGVSHLRCRTSRHCSLLL